MRICLILEGSYPYTHGGVSSWAHQMISAMKEHEFVLWVIGPRAKDKGDFFYEIPDNVVEIKEVFLDDALRIKPDRKKIPPLNDEEKETLSHFLDCEHPNWEILLHLFQDKHVNPSSFLMSKEFLDVLQKLCDEKYPYVPFANTFHTMRSMLLPVLYMLMQDVPKADLYHTICTGYAGIIAITGGYKTGKPVLLTEHGIYSREREEEIIRAQWVQPAFKRQWIKFFYMLSDAIYQRSVKITSLFERAEKTQIELGADPARCSVIPNGIRYERFCDIPLKPEDGMIDIAAVIRIAQIKDIKSLIYAFHELKSKRSDVRLHILGGVDEDEYYEECLNLVDSLGLKDDILFTGQVNIVEYMKKIDFTILTSISEGQPLSVLESLAARRPCVATDVGCCRELLEGGPSDHFGVAGFLAPPMHREGIARAMEKMCKSRSERVKMGEIGQKRVEAYYRHEDMLRLYEELYKSVF
ncbi:Glycosyltransferase involved in cell wall bisynthesis [Butyrivibrio fibrisolvens DSM 3071]|uniref:Glycosyltransferase involved in cell wall bisynthesis n=1 Tax=Butyrivibrio fibrisolvens DSM 3071 TaxID=1121131 RepID=A0A1M6FS48_BUTFI|nr:GT4 family glycosyltransferase PelF [Butyrivibrio fibrisolvens]SHJ00449.1 Glycosyltransferase involved in cell wall bisynthesis [Butyrivibrio fibrisolvens DSM 3071]